LGGVKRGLPLKQRILEKGEKRRQIKKREETGKKSKKKHAHSTQRRQGGETELSEPGKKRSNLEASGKALVRGNLTGATIGMGRRNRTNRVIAGFQERKDWEMQGGRGRA